VTARVTVERVAWNDARAVELRRLMDVDMAERYGDGRDEPPELVRKRARALSVRTADIRATLLAIAEDGASVGHIALRTLGDEWEIKRLLVLPGMRRRGVARALLAAVEDIARGNGARRVILQAGDRQPEAVALYERHGYTRIPVYEPYVETMPWSFCFEKPLAAG
jgi:GNAT superfamily N-acetyltransferase